MNPRTLDYLINGVPVYIRRRPTDGVAYATTYDFSRFIKEPPLATVRVRIEDATTVTFEELKQCPQVRAKLAEFNRA